MAGYTEFKSDLVINKMTKAQYEELLARNAVLDTEIYYIIDDNDQFYFKSEVYTKAEVDELIPRIVFSSTEPPNPVLGTIWLKPIN